LSHVRHEEFGSVHRSGYIDLRCSYSAVDRDLTAGGFAGRGWTIFTAPDE
jgi:hypothetical protein